MRRVTVSLWKADPDDPDALRCDELTCNLKAEWDGEYDEGLGTRGYLAACDRHLVSILRGVNYAPRPQADE